MIEDQPFKVRTWYGLPAEIVVGRTWHWVRAAGLPLSHTGHAEHEAVLREVPKTSAVCCPLTVWTSLRPVRCGWSSRQGCRSAEGGSSVVLVGELHDFEIAVAIS